MLKVSVIVVNYKRPIDTIECARSLERGNYKQFNLIVVDNGSHDGSPEMLRQHCPGARVLANDINCGFAEGNNIGIRHALADEAEFFLLLNNDTVVEPDALLALVDTMREHPDAGIVGAKIYYFDRPHVLWFAGGYFHVDAASGGHYGLNEEDDGSFETLRECDFVTGCCMLIRRRVINTIGLLERSYFAYLEDADYCVHARRAGYKVLFQPRARIYHKVSSTSSWDSPVYIYFNLRNKILFLRRNSSAYRWIPHLPRLIYFYVRQFVRLFFKWRDLPGTKAAWLGLTDGLRNFTGTYGEGHLNELT